MDSDVADSWIMGGWWYKVHLSTFIFLPNILLSVLAWVSPYSEHTFKYANLIHIIEIL